MEYDSDYLVNLGSMITVSVIGDRIIGFRFSENKPLMPTNIVFFDFKSCL